MGYSVNHTPYVLRVLDGGTIFSSPSRNAVLYLIYYFSG